MSISEKLCSVISNVTNKQINLTELADKNLNSELGLTSVDALELLIRIEGEFGITIDDSDLSLELLSDFQTLEKYVSSKLNSDDAVVA
ncbi:acyl carrier protein [Hahella ganghwensis]|uniref:acyl carrier protein n=1 Tax=Hahella ganghwensis TaxID=286420 RepID=UPI000367F76D|nr:acyl carrier protein [Hahella ganghwensis]